MGKKVHSKNKGRKAAGKNDAAAAAAKKGLFEVDVEAFSVSNDVDIFTRLPVKSLLELSQRVPKVWESIVENPSFVDKHFSHSLNRTGGGRMLVSFSNLDGSKHYFFSVGLYGGSGVHEVTLPGCNKGPNKPCHCHVSESVKGLFCFFNGRDLYVFNPATRSVQPIPKSLESAKRYESVETTRILDKSYSAYAFGCDSCTNVFKVLHIMGITKSGMKVYDLECEVYTVCTPSRRSNDEKPENLTFSWKKIAHVPPCPYPFKSQGVCVNGFIYWLGMTAPAVEGVVRFDVANEKFQMISLPTEISVIPILTRVGERLALFGSSNNNNNNKDANSSVEFWRLDDDDENKLGWSKESFEVPCSHRRLKHPVALGNTCSGDVLLVADVISEEYLLIPFPSNKANCSSKRKINIRGLPGFLEFNGVKHANFNITNYVESFVNVEPRLLRLGYTCFYV
ncbi:hypothetical protein CCACVL1_09064 [Corchorus capsularis]|uniref:F-box associated beta-propeller type 3 domain-containing protein n=1 Tax=Corchorus capsularis TaxID=210143 RepID=A0A1R3IXX5_COCAP|nr:hypothetical protein CCACVL1_09064 [Corchorus capsularis]